MYLVTCRRVLSSARIVGPVVFCAVLVVSRKVGDLFFPELLVSCCVTAPLKIKIASEILITVIILAKVIRLQAKQK
jgi:hypothetical protein